MRPTAASRFMIPRGPSASGRPRMRPAARTVVPPQNDLHQSSRSSPRALQASRPPNTHRAITDSFEDATMARMLPDPTFYPSARMASEAPTETLAYVALLTSEQNGKKDALGVVDTDPSSADYGRLVGKLEFPNGGNELHHFGWNACSSHLCAYVPNPHIERRFLVVPGTHSSRIHVVDTQPDP